MPKDEEDLDTLLVLRDKKEEDSGLTFDDALKRFSNNLERRLYQKARFVWGCQVNYKVDIINNGVRHLFILFRARNENITLFQLPYCWIDTLTGEVLSLPSRTGPAKGDIFLGTCDVSILDFPKP